MKTPMYFLALPWLLLPALLCLSGSLYAQHTELLPVGSVWYYADQYPSSTRLVVTEEGFTAERYKTYGVEVPYWEEDRKTVIEASDLSANLLYTVISNPGRPEAGKGGAVMQFFEEGQLMAMAAGSEQVASLDAVREMAQLKVPQRLYLSEPFYEQVAGFKGLGELSKEDLIDAIRFVQGFKEPFTAFVEANPERGQFMIGQFAQQLYHLRLFALGYNPYDLPMSGNYMDKFKEDEEVAALFRSQTLLNFGF